MATVTQDPGAGSFTPINIWAMLRALINNNVPILTINGTLFPVTSGASGTYAGQAGPGSLLIDFANAVHYINVGTLASPIWSKINGSALTPLTANGAINSHLAADYIITKAGSALLTLAAPTATVDDGTMISITSNTAFAHVLSAIGLLQTGTAFVNYVDFNAFPGATVTLQAYQGKWNVLSFSGVAFQ